LGQIGTKVQHIERLPGLDFLAWTKQPLLYITLDAPADFD
jgi:hypothetical protein